MKTWEMIKELTEHPDKKFINVLGNKVGMIDGEVSWIASGEIDQNCFVICKNEYVNNVDLNWEEVIEPVDFLTAYKDCLENDTKYVCEDYCNEFNMYKNKYGGLMISRPVGNYESNLKIANVNLSGKWIKEV